MPITSPSIISSLAIMIAGFTVLSVGQESARRWEQIKPYFSPPAEYSGKLGISLAPAV